jgi:hypothetical protein
MEPVGNSFLTTHFTDDADHAAIREIRVVRG